MDSTTKPETPPPTTATIVVMLFFDGVAAAIVGVIQLDGSGLGPARLPLEELTLNISTPFKIASL
jgi:hypothetical protein